MDEIKNFMVALQLLPEGRFIPDLPRSDKYLPETLRGPLISCQDAAESAAAFSPVASGVMA